MGDDLHQGGAGAVEVHVGGARNHIVDQFAGVLLQVQALDAHHEGRAIVALHLDEALADDRILVLADLIALRQIGIKVVLAVEAGPEVDLRLQPQARAHRLLDAATIDHGQHAGHGGVDKADLLVRAGAETHGGAAEQLGVGGDLGVNLKAQNDFPGAGAAFDQFGSGVGHDAGLTLPRAAA